MADQIPLDPLTSDQMTLVRPGLEHLASYLAALRAGYVPARESAETEPDQRLIDEVLADPQHCLDLCEDRAARGGPIRLKDGSFVDRLPSITRWMWDGGFAGAIHLRWQEGTAQLPPTCLGHIGYSVVSWKRGRGYATSALAQILPLARDVGLAYVEVTTDLHNKASQRVISKNGAGQPIPFEKPPQNGGGPALRFRIDISRTERFRVAPGVETARPQ